MRAWRNASSWVGVWAGSPNSYLVTKQHMYMYSTCIVHACTCTVVSCPALTQMLVACSTNIVKRVKLVTCSDITRTFVDVVILKRPFVWMLEDDVAVTSGLTCSCWLSSMDKNMTAWGFGVSLYVHLTSLLVVGEGKKEEERGRERKEGTNSSTANDRHWAKNTWVWVRTWFSMTTCPTYQYSPCCHGDPYKKQVCVIWNISTSSAICYMLCRLGWWEVEVVHGSPGGVSSFPRC